MAAAQATGQTERAQLIDQANRLTELREGVMACYMAGTDAARSSSDPLGIEQLYSKPVQVEEQTMSAVDAPSQGPPMYKASQLPPPAVPTELCPGGCMMHQLHCVCGVACPEPAADEVFVDAPELACSAVEAIPLHGQCKHSLPPAVFTVQNPSSINYGRQFLRCSKPRSQQCNCFEW